MSEGPNIFLSWSGSRSRAMAEALHGWLRRVIQSARPFHSDKDIETGAFWDDAIRANLATAKFAIVCCTPENVVAPWLNYEAGALAERLGGRTTPLLLGARPEALKVSPLSRLQAREADRPGTLDVLRSLNANLPQPLDDQILAEAFETHWRKLEDKLRAIPVAEVKTPERSEKEMLEEVVGLCRELAAGSPRSEHYVPRAVNENSKFFLPMGIRKMIDQEVLEYLRANDPGAGMTTRYDLASQMYQLAEYQWREHGAVESRLIRKAILIAVEAGKSEEDDPST